MKTWNKLVLGVGVAVLATVALLWPARRHCWRQAEC